MNKKKLRYTKATDENGTITTFDKAVKGPKPKANILRYKCTLGSAMFIINGEKPQCAVCGEKDLAPCIELEQLALWGGAQFDLVMQCAACGQHSLFKYEIE